MTTRYHQSGTGDQQKILVNEDLHRVHLGEDPCTTRTWPLLALLPDLSLLRGRRGHRAVPHPRELFSEAIPMMIRTLPQNMNVLVLVHRDS